uniref:Uncharacterized protein n=1 Tax=Rhizophora mucronata TaxID=61149 RepID=A0A2P2PR89_RHIMU
MNRPLNSLLPCSRRLEQYPRRSVQRPSRCAGCLHPWHRRKKIGHVQRFHLQAR